MTTLAAVIGSGTFAGRPSAGIEGRLYYATDLGMLYRDNGASWDTLGLSATLPLAAAGDLLTYDTAPARLPVGADGDLLTADSLQPSGLSWVAPAVPGGQFTWRGAWNSGTAYVTGDAVRYNGLTYVAIASNTASAPVLSGDGTDRHIITSQTPANTAVAAPDELGAVFFLDTPGVATGLRFWKDSSETGSSRTLRLWNYSGTATNFKHLIASANTASEGSSGWQSATLATPALLSPNVLYVASYPCNGHAVSTLESALLPLDNGPLHVGAHTGLLSSTLGNYPFGRSAAYYFVDVAFQYLGDHSPWSPLL